MSATLLDEAWREHGAAAISVAQSLVLELGSGNPVEWMMAHRRAMRAGPGDTALIEPLERLAAPMRTSRVSELLATLFSRAGDHERALAHLADAIRFVPSWDPLAVSQVLNSAGFILLNAGRHEEAARWAERALAYDPCYTNLLGTLCQALARSDARRAASIGHYLAATDAPPEMWSGVTVDESVAPYAPSLAGLRRCTEPEVFRLLVPHRYNHNRYPHVKATALALALAAHGRLPQALLATLIALEHKAPAPHLGPLRELIAAALLEDARREVISGSGAFALADETRLAAVRALEAEGNRAGLRGLVFDVSPRVTLAACEALTRLGEGSSVALYAELLAEVAAVPQTR